MRLGEINQGVSVDREHWRIVTFSSRGGKKAIKGLWGGGTSGCRVLEVKRRKCFKEGSVMSDGTDPPGKKKTENWLLGLQCGCLSVTWHERFQGRCGEALVRGLRPWELLGPVPMWWHLSSEFFPLAETFWSNKENRGRRTRECFFNKTKIQKTQFQIRSKDFRSHR